MESPEFNLSVLENVTFSTPLKDRSDYEAILSLIKEEIDISQTEDEGLDQSCPNNASCPRARRPDSEIRDYDGKFKSPYAKNHSAKTKSPGSALFSRTKRRSHDDAKIDTRKHAAERARTLGHIMPGRSHKSTGRQHRSSGSYSDTSGFSDSAENGKTLKRKSLTPKKKFVNTTDAYETEGEALEELLTMAQEQVIVNGSPCGRNSTVSSQSELTSLATSDPLDTGAMEEECYVESSQPIYVSDFHKKLLNHRTICNVPKNVEMIKRNLHFSDALESEEDCQNFSLALSPEPTPLLNSDFHGKSAPAVGRKRKESQDSVASILNSLTSSSSNFYSQREASTTPPRPRMGKSSQDSIARAFTSSTTNSYNSQNQKAASTTSQLSSMSKTSRESTPDIQNSPYDLHDLERKRQASTTPQPYTRKTSRKSTPSTASTLNVIHDLEDFEPEREASTTPEPCTRKRRQGSMISATSTASTLNLPHDLQDLDPEREASTTLQPSNMSKTCQDSSPENLAQDLPNFNPENEASATLPHPRKRKTSRDSRDTLLKNLAEEFDLNNFDSAKGASVTPLRSRERKTSQGSTASSTTNLTREMKNLVHEREGDASPLHPGKPAKTSQARIDRTSKSLMPNSCNSHNQRETSPTAEPSSMTKMSHDSTSNIQESVTQDPQNLDAKREAIASRSKHRKMIRGSITNSQESLTQDLENLHFKREASATPPYPRHRRTSNNSMSSSQNSFTPELSNFDCAQDDRQVTPPRPRKRKTSQASTVSSVKGLTQDSSNVDSTKEASITPPRPKKKRKKKSVIATPLEGLTQDSSNVDSSKEARVTLSRPKKKRKKKSDVATSLEGSTQDTTNVDSAQEASLPLPISTKKKNNKTKIASPPNNVTEDLTNVVPETKPSMTSPHPRKRKSSVVSPLKGLTQELENCIMNVDFERLCEEIDNDTESPSFTFETVQLLDDYDDCNPAANNKILSKILASPDSKTDEEAPRSVEHIGSTEDPLDYDPLYIIEADHNETTTPSTSKGKEKTGTTNARNEKRRVLVDESVTESKRRVDKDVTLEELPRRSSRSRKTRVNMPASELEEEDDLSDKTAQVSKKVKNSSEDSLDYDALYVTEAEDSETATSSTSKRKKKTATKKKGSKIKSFSVDKSFKACQRIDKVDTLEEETRYSLRTLNRRVTITTGETATVLDEADLADEAGKVEKKVRDVMKKERLSPETFDKLDNIVVQLRHQVLPQHDIEERAGTIPLTYKQQMNFLDFASLNKDVYSTEEDDIIKRNWNAFCVDHDWDPQNYRVFLHFKHGNRLIMSSLEQRRKFVQFLADGLPNRPLYSVYNRFKKIYSEYADAGEWYSLAEDKKILAWMLHNPNKKPETKFAELSKALRRPRQSIWKRYKNLKLKETLNDGSKQVMRKVEWHLSLVTEFITKLLNVTISEDLTELKDAFIPIVVWRKLEEKIEIDYNFMKRSWEQQFHMQFFSPEPLSANAIKIKLIEYMWLKGIRDGIDIQWHVVVKYFDGCTTSFLRKTFNHLTSEASREINSRSLSDIMKWLHDIKIDRLRRRRTDHYLPRLRYVDKRVEIVPEDTTKVTLIETSASLDE